MALKFETQTFLVCKTTCHPHTLRKMTCHRSIQANDGCVSCLHGMSWPRISCYCGFCPEDVPLRNMPTVIQENKANQKVLAASKIDTAYKKSNKNLLQLTYENRNSPI